ncbi:MAG: ImmA/IrrE family metallo-endopeptidase [Fastidiosipilaceae bacterium]
MSAYIHETVEALKNSCQTDNVFDIARDLGVFVSRRELGGLKGFYAIINNERHIVINPALAEPEQRAVCAHELGHDQLHRRFVRASAFREFTFFDLSRQPEFQANLFAAELLISDEVMLEEIRRWSLPELNMMLELPPGVAELKFRSLKNRGLCAETFLISDI